MRATIDPRSSRLSGLVAGLSILAALVTLTACPAASSQADPEAVARLHFTAEAARDGWFEGYAGILAGSFSPYASHRSDGQRDSAFVARTLGEESSITWTSAPISRSWDGDSASIVWVCGFGNNLGEERFDLVVNGADTLTFRTRDEAAWSVSGAGGVRLSFTAAAVNPNGANLGYMVLTLPRAKIPEGGKVTVRVRGVEARTEVWYRLFAYRDAFRHLLEAERRDFFFRIDLLRNGDASLALCGRSAAAESPVRLLLSGAVIGKGRLQADGVIAKTTILVSRTLQPAGDEPTVIEVAGKAVDTLRWTEIARRRLGAFLLEELEADRYVFPPGELPEIGWKNPEAVEREMGSFPLKVSYYDGSMRPVTRAGGAGRYAAVVEAELPSGFRMRRFITLFCSTAEFDDYGEDTPITLNPLKEYGIGDAQWRMYGRNERRYSFGSMKMFPAHDPDAAVFLAGLSELDSAAIPYDTPRLRDRQWWIAFKQRLSGGRPATLPLPEEEDGKSPPLDEHPASTAPFTPAHLERIRAVCREWAVRTGVPHVALVAHDGRVVFHEAFNAGAGSALIDTGSTIWMASITKLLTGALMMRFVDRGLVDLDAPVARYLPELPDSATAALTVRQLFTHVTGLEAWDGEWASDWNTSLENHVAQALPMTAVGRRFSYNRAGYAVAGKVMERLAGRAVPYLFQDHLFTPLGMHSAFSDNTYGGLYCTAADLARLGQMLLNRGVYAGRRIFSGESYGRMLPAPVPGTDRRWGIGTSPMEEPGLGEGAFGHAAASGAMFRVDPEHGLLIVSARNRVGGDQEEFERRLVEACTAPFRDK
jgi:CubicO group peptidase (beta-lactamase class C family)